MDEQCIDELNAFNILTDDKIANICKMIFSPGGLITNPTAAITLPVGTATTPTNIPSPRNQISDVAKEIFKLVVYFVKQQ